VSLTNTDRTKIMTERPNESITLSLNVPGANTNVKFLVMSLVISKTFADFAMKTIS